MWAGLQNASGMAFVKALDFYRAVCYASLFHITIISMYRAGGAGQSWSGSPAISFVALPGVRIDNEIAFWAS